VVCYIFPPVMIIRQHLRFRAIVDKIPEVVVLDHHNLYFIVG
jgi:hypothetical protein